MGENDNMLFPVICIIILKLSDAACTWPTDFQSTGTAWRDSDKGILNFTSDSLMSGWTVTVKGFTVSSWECFMSNTSANIVIARASSTLTLHQYVFVPYLCMKITKFTDHTYIYYLKSEQEPSASYERVYVREEGSSNTALATQTELCQASPNASEYHTLVRWASRALANIECPTVLLGSFRYSYTDSSASTCGNGNEVWDGCTDTKSMTFNYTMCSTRIAYSAIGTVRCIVSFTSGTYSFATVYNTDLSTDESTTYLFTCMMASKSGSTVSVSLSPKSCSPTQTPDTVPVTATGSTLGANMTLTPYVTCDPTVTTTTSTTVTTTTTINTSTANTTTTSTSGGGSSTKNTVVDLTIIIAVSVVAGLLLVILIALAFYIGCIRKSKFARKTSTTGSEMQKKQETKTSKKSDKAEYGKRTRLSSKSNLPDVCEPVLEEHKLNGVVRAMEENKLYSRSKASVGDKTPTHIVSSPENMIKVKSADYTLSEFEDESLPATPRTPRRDSLNIIPFRENPKDVYSKSQRERESDVSKKRSQGEKEKKAMSLVGSAQNNISGQLDKDQSMENKTYMKTGNNSELTDNSVKKIMDQERILLAKSVEQGVQNRQEIVKKTGKESPLVNNAPKTIVNDFKTTENCVDENTSNSSSSKMTNESKTTEKSDENKKIEICTPLMVKESVNSDHQHSADSHATNDVSNAKRLDPVSPNVTQAKEVDKGHLLQNKDEGEQTNSPSKQNPDLNGEAVMSTPGKAVYAVNTGPKRKRNPKTPTKRNKSHKKNAKEKKTNNKDAKGNEQLIPSTGVDGQHNAVDEGDKGDNFAKDEHQQVESDNKEESPSSNNQVPQVGDSNPMNTMALSPEPKSSPENVVPPLLLQQVQENANDSDEEHDHVETDRTGVTTDSELDCGRTEEEDIFDDTVIGKLLSSVSISAPRSRLDSLEAASRASSKLTRTPTGISIGLIGYKEGTGFFPELPTHYETGQPPTNSFFLTKMSLDLPK